MQEAEHKWHSPALLRCLLGPLLLSLGEEVAVQFIEPKPGGSSAKLMVASVMVHILGSTFWMLGGSWGDFPMGRKQSLMIVGNVEVSPWVTEHWWRSKAQTAPSLVARGGLEAVAC